MIVYGKNIVLYALEHNRDRVEEIYLAKEIDQKLFHALSRSGKRIVKLDPKKAQAMATGGNHQGFLAKLAPFETVSFESLKDANFVILLSGLTDMGNIGAIIRSAYSFGCDAVIVGGINQPKFETIVRSSSGAALSTPLCVYFDTADALNRLRQIGFQVVGATLDGIPLKSASFQSKRVLVLGSEGEGFPKKISDKFDCKVTIEMKRPFDSLNVSAAAAILIHAIA